MERHRRFDSLGEAVGWCQDQGYAVGFTQGWSPIALAKNAGNVSKWRNIPLDERLELDGIIIPNEPKIVVALKVDCVGSEWSDLCHQE